MNTVEQLRFLNEEQVREIHRFFGSPVYVYDQATLIQRAKELLAFPNAYGLTARYAMKALPTTAILQIFAGLGLHIDASSGYEVERALKTGFPPQHIQLTAQQLPDNLEALIQKGVLFNACSLHQCDVFGKIFPGRDISVRINPGLGSGGSNRTNVGGPSSSFGIWHEHLDELKALAQLHQLRITQLHTHIGSGSDPEIWVHCAKLALKIAAKLPEVTTLSLGGGYKVGRMKHEPSADLQADWPEILSEFERFASDHNRKLHLEVEPGTYLVANAGSLLCKVIDIVDTGTNGYRFIKLDAGMTEILRPGFYGAQHPIISISAESQPTQALLDYVVVGHCCESGDILTPEPGNPENLKPRLLRETAIGDSIVIEGSGAYCASMASKNYNSFPECAEVLLTNSEKFTLIRKRQTFDQMLQNEVWL